MSLLLQALQKAAKSREESEVDLSGDALAMADELELEPTPAAPRTQQASPASPTSAHAATVVQAGSVPAFDALEYAREHYMLSLVSIAILFAAGYGTYVYLQVNQPFRHSTPVSSPTAAAPAPQAPLVSALPAPADAKISGMPGGATTPVASAGASATAIGTGPTATAPDQRTAPASPAIRDEPAATGAVARKSTATKLFPGDATKLRRLAGSASLADASDSIETVVIPPSQPKPSSDISVRRDAASVTPISPTLMQAYETLQSGDHARAKGLYEEVLRAEPRNIDALLGLGAIALTEGHIDDASRYYQRVLELDPRNSYAQAGLISIVGGADLPASESRLKQLIARDPSAFLYFSLGNLYAEQGQWPSAQQAYFQAYQMQKDNPDYAFNLAVGLEHLGQNRLALDFYRKALDLSFKKGHANFDQSLVIQRVGQLSTRVEQ
jgi:tetratricopeptide (TPR) repeat protein